MLAERAVLLKEILQISIVVVIQTANRHALAVALQFAAYGAVLPAVAGLDCETTVGPQLALGTKTVRGLQQGHQQGRANRADGRNLAQ